MEFLNKDVNGNKPRQYDKVRKKMAKICCIINIKIFDPEPVTIRQFEVNLNGREEPFELDKGIIRIMRISFVLLSVGLSPVLEPSYTRVNPPT